MFSEAILILLGFTYWDNALLKKQNKQLYLSTFQVSKNICLGVLLFVGFILIFDAAWFYSTAVLILAFVFPIYFTKRYAFLKSVEGSNKFWAATQGLGVILYWFFGMLLFSSVVPACYAILGEGISELEEMVLAAVFSSTLLIYLIERSTRSLGREDFWISMGFSEKRISFVKKFIFPMLLGLGMAYFSATIISTRDVQPSTPLSEALAADTSTWAVPLFIILALVVAPIVEEITFRGYFFKILKRTKGQRVAFYTIALTFGILHMAQYWGDWAAIVVVMIMGFLLTFVRVWTGTTAASVTMHYFYNGGVVVIAAMLEILKEAL